MHVGFEVGWYRPSDWSGILVSTLVRSSLPILSELAVLFFVALIPGAVQIRSLRVGTNKCSLFVLIAQIPAGPLQTNNRPRIPG
jgi:hypothetical protein